MQTISLAEFEKVDIRVGTVIRAEVSAKAKKPAYKLWIDFGALGIKKSSAQVTDLYSVPDLENKQVLAVVNFPPKQIADFMSECLVLGVYTENQAVVLLSADQKVPNGLKVG